MSIVTAKGERLYRIILHPVITEKSSGELATGQQFVFAVLPDATKQEIKLAVEKFFSVEVERVQVVNVRGKAKRFGRIAGKRSNWKKAYVRLKQGHDIDIIGFARA